MSSKHTTAVIRHGKAVLLLTAVMVTTTGGTVAPEVITKCDAALRCQDSMQGSCNFNWFLIFSHKGDSLYAMMQLLHIYTADQLKINYTKQLNSI